MKNVKGYEDLYRIDKSGNVFGKTYKKGALKYSISRGGYRQVVLFKNGKGKCFFIHALMAITYLNHIPNGKKVVIDHIDNDKTNNKLDNLKIVTARENVVKYKNGKYPTGVIRNGNRFVAKIIINNKYNHIGTFATPEEAHNAYIQKLKTITNT